MKTLALLSLLPLMLFVSKAQPVVDISTVKSVMNSGIREYISTDADGIEFATIDEGSTDNEFHFESLTYRHCTEVLKYHPFDGGRHREIFPHAQYSNLILEGEDMHAYFSFRGDTLFHIGSAGIVQGSVMVADYIPDWIWYIFPLHLGDSWSWRHPEMITIPDWDLSEESICETDVIAAGTIYLPEGAKKCLVVRRSLVSTLRMPHNELIVEALDYEFICEDGTVAIATIREEDIGRIDKRLSKFRYEKLEGTNVREPSVAADELQLHPAFPNPTEGGRSTISWSARYDDHVRVTLHDPRGRLLQELYTGRAESETRWLRLDLTGRPRGTYFVRLSGGSGTRIATIHHFP